MDDFAKSIERELDDLDHHARMTAVRRGSTLADHVINAARDPRRELGVISSIIGPKSRARVAEISASVRAAQKILLDPSFVTAAARFSLETPSTILRYLSCVQAPGPLTWIEWDERTRLSTLIENGYHDEGRPVSLGQLYDNAPDSPADRVGFLIQEHGSLMSIGVVTQNIDKKKHPLILQFLGYWFSPITPLDLDLLSHDDLQINRSILARERQFGMSFALGGLWHKLNMGDGSAYHSITDHVAYRWFGIPCVDDIGADLENKMCLDAAVATAGDLRFLISVLCLLSSETISDAPWTSAGVRAPSRSARLRTPGSVFRTLKVEAPYERLMERVLAYEPPATPSGRRMRRHDVIAHVCRSRRRGSPLCEHDFDREELPRFCKSCGYREWRRRAHERGDESLGRVYGPRVLTAPGDNRMGDIR